MECDSCTYYAYDEDDESYYCAADIDEDDMAMMMQSEAGHRRGCPYWVSNDEYAVVRHQAF